MGTPLKSLAEMNAALRSVTIVRRIEFRSDAATGECSFALEMMDDLAQLVELDAGDVSAWSVQDFGGGVTQVTGLQLKDVRHLQHDRVHFVLEDVEDQKLSLQCARVEMHRD